MWRCAVVVEEASLEGRHREATYRGEVVDRDTGGNSPEHRSLETLLLTALGCGVEQPLTIYMHHDNLHNSITTQAALHRMATSVEDCGRGGG